MLKRIFREHGRHRPSELAVALSAVAPGELVRGIVELFTAGELRLHSRKRKRALCPRFYRYHAANSWVADWFLRTAQAKRDEGRTHYAIGNLLEKLRHDVSRGVIKTDDFHISNDYQSAYARVVLMRDPSLCGFFALKPSDADVLVVDGRPWSEFAKQHEAELWPQRTAKKKAVLSEQPELPLETETA